MAPRGDEPRAQRRENAAASAVDGYATSLAASGEDAGRPDVWALGEGRGLRVRNRVIRDSFRGLAARVYVATPPI